MTQGGIPNQTFVRNSRTVNDQLAAGATLVSGAGNTEDDFNAIRSQINRILDATMGGHFYDGPANSFGLKQVSGKFFVFQMPQNPSSQKFTLGGTVGGVVLPSTVFIAGDRLIAVGASSSTNRGYVAANEAGFTVAGVLGVGLTTISDADGNVLNVVRILGQGTNTPPETSNGEEIFGLLQAVSGTTDGAAIGGGGSENLQVSFAYKALTTQTLTATTLPAGTYLFAPTRQRALYDLTSGFVLGTGGLPDVIDPGAATPRLPCRSFDITSATVAVDDGLTVTSGVFGSAGAQSAVAANSFGTPALPANGTLFQNDERIRVHVNGNRLVRGQNAAALTARNGALGVPGCYWKSSTQIAFNFILYVGDVVEIESPSAY